MTDRMRVIVEGQDNASDEFRRIGQNATQMGRTVDQASDVMERGFRGVNAALDSVDRNTAETVRAINRLADAQEQAARSTEKLDRTTDRFSKTGAAIGAVMSTTAGILSEFARAAAEEEVTFQRLESAVEATGESFDTLEPSIAAAVAAAEDLSFADDQAAEALTRLTTITGSTQEALDLLGLSMDVARGRGISLAEAATLVGRAAEGQVTALTRMGIVLQEGATAQDALNELQRRYAGQSEAYADTTQGSIDRLKNSFNNWAESIGASTGELQLILTLLPGLSVGFSGLATVMGGLVTTLGPIGLVAAAVAASAAVGYLVYQHVQEEQVVVDVDEATKSLIDTLNRLAAAQGEVSDQFIAGARWREAAEEIFAAAETYAAAEERLKLAVLEGRVFEGIGGQEAVQTGVYADAVSYAEGITAKFRVTTEEANQITALLAQSLQYTGEQFAAVSEHVDEAVHDFLSGRITLDAFIARLEAIPEIALSAAGATTDLADAEVRLARATEEAARAAEQLAAAWSSQPIDAQTAFVEAQADAAARLTRNNIAQMVATRDVVQAQRDAEAAFLAGAEASRQQAVSLDDAALAMGSMEYASFAAIDGVVSLTEQERLLTVQGAELAAQQSAVASELGVYRSAVNDMEAAYEELQARQAAGEALNQSDIDFMREYEAEADGTARTIGDLVIEQGKLAQAQLDNVESQDALNETMGDTADAVGDLVEPLTLIAEALAELAGISLDNLMPPERTAVAWTEVAQGIKAARDALSGYAPPTPSTPGDASGGPYPLGQGNAGTPQGGTIKIVVDAAAAYAELNAVQDRAEYVMDGPNAAGWTMEIGGDGEQAFAVIRDVDGDVVRLVTADYTVVIDGDGLSAKEEISEVSRQLADLNGSHATVYADADISNARAQINSLLGFQGRGYVIVDGIGGTRVGPADLTAAYGAVIPAASGRVVRAGEIGPELVYPPGGAPYVAAAHGLYAMETGSVVSNAPTTRAALQQGGRSARPIVINGPVTVVANNPREFMSQMQAIGR